MTVLAAPGALTDLPTIGLEELNATASLLTRVDRKYLLPAHALDEVVGALPAGSRVLEVHGERTPLYDTVYMDTPELDAYLATARRRGRRWKVRTRSYVASDLHFLEVKTRSGSLTRKRRLPWPGGPLQGAVGDFVEQCLRETGLAPDVRRLTPQLRTGYRRATILLPGRPTRLTIDLDLTWTPPAGDGGLAWRDSIVVETKTSGPAGDVERALWRAGHRPIPLSKYGCGLALLRPDLPRNRWHRLLAA